MTPPDLPAPARYSLPRLPAPAFSRVVWLSQYFESEDPARQSEIDRVIQLNCDNPQIDDIFLLNEVIYPNPILQHPKVKQVNLGSRLSYKSAFDFAETHLADSTLVVLSNLDITFDADDLKALRFVELHQIFLALTRYDILSLDPPSSELFRYWDDVSCSQDTWIFSPSHREWPDDFNILLGIPGCDGRLVHLLDELGIAVINPCLTIHTYHHHQSGLRTYDRDRLTYENLGVKYLEYGALSFAEKDDGTA